ncbi:MAG: TetR family transcriptional regulator [Firmicutes bacterium]|nr:TetR family transcriptional regulator [Bacillota bacterium]
MRYGTSSNIEEAIQEAFSSLMEQQPYSAIRVTQIIRAAHISHQSFYRFYQNKAELAVNFFSDQLLSAVVISGKQATFREIMMNILQIIRNNSAVYAHLLCDKEGSLIFPEILTQMSSEWTGFFPAWATTVINSQFLIDWANDGFQESLEQTYAKFVYNLPAYELLSETELKERIRQYESRRSTDFLPKRHKFVSKKR